MTKTELVKEVASRIEGMTQKDVKEVLEAVQAVAFDAVKADDEVALMDGVKVGRKFVPTAERRNPATGEKIVVEEHYKPVVKFGKFAKETVR